MSLISTLLPIIRSVFSRWTALQLAVSHSMGGSESEAKYDAFIEDFGRYLIRHVRPAICVSAVQQEIQEYLDEVLDEEFNTVIDDGSSTELAQLFIRYTGLIQQGKLADVQQELQVQESTTSRIQKSVRNKTEEDLSSSSSDDDDDGQNDNQEMRDEQADTESKSQAMDVDEEGWMTVHRRGGGKK